MRRFVFIALALLALLGGSVFLLARWYTAAFPDLAPGVYVGTLKSDSPKRVFPFIVAKRANEQSLAVAIGDLRVSAQRIAPIDPFGKTRQPLVIGQSDVRLRLTGSETAEGRYAGDYDDPISRESGSWTLEKARLSGIDQGTETELSRWFSIWQELSSIESEIQTAQKQVDEQRQSIDDLHSYVSDGSTLRKTADVRLGRADSEIDSARDDLRERQRRLDRELRDFDLSQRISQEGRLVFLSRETIQRESRWIELTLKLLEPETSIGFDQALERAERVRALKNAIAKERAEPKDRDERTPTPTSLKRETETDKEEEFYGQLE